MAVQRIDDEHVRCRRVAFGLEVDASRTGVGVDLLQGGGKRRRVAGDFGAARIGFVLAATADRHLDEGGGHRREDHDGDDADEAAGAFAVIAAEEEGKVGKCGDGAGDGGGDRHGQRVAVLHVRKLVAHDGADLAAVEHGEKARGGGDGGVGRVAAGGEGVGLVALDDGDLGHGQAGALGHVAHVIGIGAHAGIGMVWSDFLRAVHREHDLVGVPVADQVADKGHGKGDRHAGRAANEIADADEQGRQRRQEHEGA